MTTKPLAGKVALITGGSKGIGRALSLRLAASGANVVVNYSSDSTSANETISAISAEHAFAVKADVGSVSDVGRLVDATIERFGKLDIVVACAGIMPLSELEKLTEEEFDRVMSVNVKGPLFLTQKAIPHMTSGGRIILFSTTLNAASTVTPNYLAYCTSKGAIDQMTRILSKDLARKGILVNAIAPGPTATDLFMKGKNEQVLKMIAGFNPQGRIGSPEEIADVAAFLAGEGSKWVTGQVIRVNGGMA
ncbi:short-chain dehydrogenase/reductase-like protein sdr [Mollisia scopiformis]|uniref:Short-chain dehydrogenase/reductase-like protein sdr n=1 Tax=Mollisia scopiformis TaxID=149040 RepID=A0A194XWB5_MOLSC|nr:short-chain dehydrogenase/reductase-like protein sdr [Mollisia scopiformis]KUJ24590.1 short-chain dehydrogenase/reductase-like protein sdr [Mollisia scopiformis]